MCVPQVTFNFSNQEARWGGSMQRDLKVPSIAKKSSLASAQVNTHTHKSMFRCCKSHGSIKIWGTKFIKGLIGLAHKQWLYRNIDVHYVSEGLRLRQHKELTTKIKILMKIKRSALLGHHRHYMTTNFDELGHGPTIACQVWVTNMEMAINIAKVAKGNFCTQDTLQQLRIPIALPSNQQSPPVPISCVTTCTPPHQYYMLFVTPGSNARHTWLSKTPYSQPHTTHCSSTPSHHPTLFPIFLRCHKTSRHRSPCFFPIFYLTNAPQPMIIYAPISTIYTYGRKIH